MSAKVTRELLQTSPVEGLPGWEMRLFLITYPPGRMPATTRTRSPA
jgi:hypothetical protein